MIQPGKPEPNTVTAALPWREELRTAVRSSAELCAALGITPAAVAGGCADPPGFPVLVPRGFLARMRHGDPRDPLLRQVLALGSELDAAPGFDADPLREAAAAADGMLEKYAGRALLIATEACPVHCRYCFRRHFPYSDHTAARGRWAQTLARLRARPDLREVILSGGDPLSLATVRLAEIVAGLEALGTVTTLRIHTRFPIVVPARVTASLLSLLRETPLRKVVVVHCNHANELADAAVADALQRLSQEVDLLLNQSVLLRGVNDSVVALSELSTALFECRVIPYYLHLLDPVAGSAHFEVPADQARSLMAGLRAALPGYLVPRLVREQPGAPGKTPVV